jgi:hypothetical protein
MKPMGMLAATTALLAFLATGCIAQREPMVFIDPVFSHERMAASDTPQPLGPVTPPQTAMVRVPTD